MEFNLETIVFDILMNLSILITIFIVNKTLFLYIIVSISIIFVIERVAINNRIEID